MPEIKIALLGCGTVQIKHIRTLRDRDDARIVALCDVAPGQIDRLIERAEMKQDGPLPDRFSEPEQMYEQTRPDAVIIATPHTMHFQNGMDALDAGCHVLMEKPMVTNAQDAYLLADQVKQAGKVFIIGYNTPCMPEFGYLRDLIRNHALGTLELVVGHLSQHWLPGAQGTWRVQPELSGGGQAYDSGAHVFNSLCWAVEARVAEVFAFLNNCGTPVDINSSINIRFENNVMASIVIGGNCSASGAHMAFLFDNGKVEICPWQGQWIKVYRGRSLVKYPPITGEPTRPADNLIDAICGRAEPYTSPTNGIIQSELMDAIYESARTGQPARPTSPRTLVG